MWGNNQPHDFHDPDWSNDSGSSRGKFPWQAIVFIAALLVIIYVVWG